MSSERERALPPKKSEPTTTEEERRSFVYVLIHLFYFVLLNTLFLARHPWLPRPSFPDPRTALQSVFLICLFSTSLICGLSCCPGLFTISLSLNAENHLAVFEMPAAAAYLCVSSFIFYLTAVNSMGSKVINHSGTTSNTALLVKCFWHNPLPNCRVKWNRTPPTGISDLSQLHALIIRLTY